MYKAYAYYLMVYVYSNYWLMTSERSAFQWRRETTASTLPVVVEHLEDILTGSDLIDTNIAGNCQQGHVDTACLVLLVVGHELEEVVIKFAVEWETTIGLTDEVLNLMKQFDRKTATSDAEV